jgi:hypothetical protein
MTFVQRNMACPCLFMSLFGLLSVLTFHPSLVLSSLNCFLVSLDGCLDCWTCILLLLYLLSFLYFFYYKSNDINFPTFSLSLNSWLLIKYIIPKVILNFLWGFSPMCYFIVCCLISNMGFWYDYSVKDL